MEINHCDFYSYEICWLTVSQSTSITVSSVLRTFGFETCPLFRPHLILKDLIFITLGLHYILFVPLFLIDVFEYLRLMEDQWVDHTALTTLIFFLSRWWWRMDEQSLKQGSMHYEEKQNRFTVLHPVFLWTTNPTKFWVMKKCIK